MVPHQKRTLERRLDASRCPLHKRGRTCRSSSTSWTAWRSQQTNDRSSVPGRWRCSKVVSAMLVRSGMFRCLSINLFFFFGSINLFFFLVPSKSYILWWCKQPPICPNIHSFVRTLLERQCFFLGAIKEDLPKDWEAASPHQHWGYHWEVSSIDGCEAAMGWGPRGLVCWPLRPPLAAPRSLKRPPDVLQNNLGSFRAIGFGFYLNDWWWNLQYPPPFTNRPVVSKMFLFPMVFGIMILKQ